MTASHPIINNDSCVDVQWYFYEGEWCYDKEMEELLSRSMPFRDEKLGVCHNRYLE